MNYTVIVRFHNGCELCQQCVDQAMAIGVENPSVFRATVSINDGQHDHSATIMAVPLSNEEEELS